MNSTEYPPLILVQTGTFADGHRTPCFQVHERIADGPGYRVVRDHMHEDPKPGPSNSTLSFDDALEVMHRVAAHRSDHPYQVEPCRCGHLDSQHPREDRVPYNHACVGMVESGKVTRRCGCVKFEPIGATHAEEEAPDG